MKPVFIVGCGYTGSALARAALAEGARVAAITRAGEAPTGVALQRGDLLRPDELDLEPARGAVVYYMVPPLFRSHEPERPHLAAMQGILQRLRRVPPAALIYLSSTSVYGDRDGAWVDEETAPRPDSPWGLMRAELEPLVSRFGSEAGVPSVVLRLPEIYGPGRGPLQRLREGYRLVNPRRWTNRIHLDDLVLVLRLLGERPAPELLLCSDDEPAPAEEVYALAATLLGRAPPEQGEEPTDPNRRALVRDSKRCRNARLRAWLARPLRYPTYREGLPASG